MNYKELEKYYLCGIGERGKINEFKVGTYHEDRESFTFSNGAYSPMELYKEPRGSNAIYVVSAICLQEIDDNELLTEKVDEAPEIFPGTKEALDRLTTTITPKRGANTL